MKLVIWHYEVIKANHDGYCSGEENIEEIYNEQYGVMYDLNKVEWNELKWFNQYHLFNKNFIEAAKPNTIYIPIDYDGSDYCRLSKHGLSHMIKKKPIKILKLLNVNEWSGRINKTIKHDSLKLQAYLQHVLAFKNEFYKCMYDILPNDMINLILIYVFM
jgi:hypothetical protein